MFEGSTGSLVPFFFHEEPIGCGGVLSSSSEAFEGSTGSLVPFFFCEEPIGRGGMSSSLSEVFDISDLQATVKGWEGEDDVERGDGGCG